MPGRYPGCAGVDQLCPLCMVDFAWAQLFCKVNISLSIYWVPKFVLELLTVRGTIPHRVRVWSTRHSVAMHGVHKNTHRGCDFLPVRGYPSMHPCCLCQKKNQNTGSLFFFYTKCNRKTPTTLWTILNVMNLNGPTAVWQVTQQRCDFSVCMYKYIVV